MQNLAIFLESNKDAAYYRQQVSERGILEKIDALNEGLLNITGVTEENLSQVYEALNEVEISLNKNANDPRTRMALQKFTIDDTEIKRDPTENPEELTDETQELTGEPTGKPDSDEDPKKLTDETQELTGEPTGEPNPVENPEGPITEIQGPTGEPTGESDPTKKEDTQELTGEPTGESDPTKKEDTQELTGEPAETADTNESTTETSEQKKGGRRKKGAE